MDINSTGRTYKPDSLVCGADDKRNSLSKSYIIYA